jgi:hypothetical protein
MLWLVAWLAVPTAFAQEPPSGTAGEENPTDSESPARGETVSLDAFLKEAASWLDPEPGGTPAKDGWKGRIQVRRENVDRGTSEETTRTYVRWDSVLWGGVLSVQVAFPDEQTDFNGSPFSPRLGDSKARYRFAPFSAGDSEVSFFIEGTFPTADPAELGTGKYQASAGVTAGTAIPVPEGMRASHVLRFTAQLQQQNSVAGDEQRPDINYTKLDLSLRDTWGLNWVRAAVNTRVDWELNGKTGAVGELEYGRRLDPNWSVWVLGGGLLWGEGVKATYGTKLMVGVDRWF